MSMVEKIEQLAEFSEQDIPLFADFDDCIIGAICRRGRYYAVYSRSKMLRQLMRDNGWDYFDSLDWFGHNIECAYGGPQSPLILIDEMPDGIGELM
jgi:hypothetical protein